MLTIERRLWLNKSLIHRVLQNYYPIFVHAILAVGGVVSALNPLYEPNVRQSILSTFRNRPLGDKNVNKN